MIEAFGWGALAASSLLLGGLLALRWEVARRPLGLIMAFGAGVLLSAVAFELVQEAFETAAGERGVGIGLAVGSITFYVGDRLIAQADARRARVPGSRGQGSSPLPIVLGIVLDGIPESIVIGVGLLAGEGVGIAMLAAVFLSNLPEALAATAGLRRSGWSTGRVLGLWTGMAGVSGVAAMVGYAVFDGVGPSGLAFTLAFAGGAVLTMLANTMMPEAYEEGGGEVGLLTTLGFGLAFFLTTFE